MFVDEFFEFETKNSLFERKTKKNFFYWDLLRMPIYLKYYWPDIKSIADTQERKTGKDVILFIVGVLRDLFYFLTNKSSNLVIPCSRYIHENGRYYDKAARNVIESLNNDYLLLETRSVRLKYLHRGANNYKDFLKFLFHRRVSFPEEEYVYLAEIMEKEFGERKITKDWIETIYNNFIFDKFYYSWIFNLKSIKRVFVTQNGLQKGLVCAARKLNIEVNEFQHGSFERDHLAYSYPSYITRESNIFVPNRLLTFGDYWGRTFNVPYEQITTIGNDFFGALQKENTDGSVLFVSSMIHGLELSALALDFAKSNSDTKVVFKLHSNEFSKILFYEQTFIGVNNIEIIRNEVSIDLLIDRCELVVLISSTALYEALNKNKKVAIFKRVNYRSQESVFDMKNVFLIEDLNSFHEIILTQTDDSSGFFFEPYNSTIL